MRSSRVGDIADQPESTSDELRNRSMPAGTGVWVVMEPGLTAAGLGERQAVLVHEHPDALEGQTSVASFM
jgi:hypothetical protein